MAQIIEHCEAELHLRIDVADDGDVRLVHFAPRGFDSSDVDPKDVQTYRLIELQCTGENQQDHHGSKYTGTMPAGRMKYVSHRQTETAAGMKLEIEQAEGGLHVVTHVQFYEGVPVARWWNEVRNEGQTPVTIEYLSSFALTGLTKESRASWDACAFIHLPHNTWMGEFQWRRYAAPELGLSNVNNGFSIRRLSVESRGTWSSAGHLPMGIVENAEAGTMLFWQIEHNGSWQWEISDRNGQLYLRASGPTFNESHWRKVLEPGETFASVPVAAGAVVGGVDEVGAALTHYRRRIRRANEDNEKLPVIFNDYMNCLFGDPTTEKLIPLIDAAAACGCEYFCIDCGWYSEGPWWDGVGEWLPSKQRFPDGLPAVLKYIRSKGMVPGLWLEIEVMGIKNPKAGRVGDEWFFQRDGKRIIDHSRYQLDFRNPKVVEHANEVIDRLVREYGVGYIKMDYNINAGVGTDRASDSAGDGLLEHNRAYLEWVDDVFARYPDLVIENCSSGGMRCDYALLSRHSIFSTSDQTDYVKYAWIAAGAPTGVTPEQAAVWSYPLKAGDREEVIFNMVSAMLMRVHQSGHLAELSEERRALVKEGLDFYKTIRGELRECVPFWPLGLPRWGDSWVALGMKWPKRTYVAVWRTDGGPETMTLPIRHLAGKKAVSARIGYPSQCDQTARWHGASGQLAITLKQRTARVIVIE